MLWHPTRKMSVLKGDYANKTTPMVEEMQRQEQRHRDHHGTLGSGYGTVIKEVPVNMKTRAKKAEKAAEQAVEQVGAKGKKGKKEKKGKKDADDGSDDTESDDEWPSDASTDVAD